MGANTLYYGDNLDVLRQHVADESVDLTYLDPPFNSKATYNMLFREQDGTRAAAQFKAFTDTWKWDTASSRAYEDLVEAGGRVADVMRAFKTFMPASDMLAYLSMMAPRLEELHRVLKPTGSIYLHCDPTASHYLKLLMDAVFGLRAFRNEIVWKRTPFAGSSKARAEQLPKSHDTILFYSEGMEWTWECPTLPYTEAYLKRFKWEDNDGRGPYRKTLLKTFSQETFKRLEAENRLIPPVKPGSKWSYKQYLLESPGQRQIDDVWTDINMLNPMAKERLHYPTQKPVRLLKRIILESSNPGDVILDPFCGCGTTIDATEQINRENPEKLPRRWIGIDITYLATNLIKCRLKDAFGDGCKYEVVGEPADLSSAAQLAEEDPYQFQWWALGLVAARPVEEKKGADKGIDGRLYFHDEPEGGETKQVIFSVKGGNLTVAHVRDLRGVLDRENAQIGLLISMEQPTKPMRAEAASAGFYESPGWKTKHPRLQLLTIEDLLAGKKVDRPPTRDERTFKKAERFKPTHLSGKALPFDEKQGV
jgi:DNA modification methylase